jgi:hypothetical protein
VLTHHGHSVWFDDQLIKGRDVIADRPQDTRGQDSGRPAALAVSRLRRVVEEAHLAHDLGTLAPVKIKACKLPMGFQRMDGNLSSCFHPGMAHRAAIRLICRSTRRSSGSAGRRKSTTMAFGSTRRHGAGLANRCSAPLRWATPWPISGRSADAAARDGRCYGASVTIIDRSSVNCSGGIISAGNVRHFKPIADLNCLLLPLSFVPTVPGRPSAKWAAHFIWGLPSRFSNHGGTASAGRFSFICFI